MQLTEKQVQAARKAWNKFCRLLTKQNLETAALCTVSLLLACVISARCADRDAEWQAMQDQIDALLAEKEAATLVYRQEADAAAIKQLAEETEEATLAKMIYGYYQVGATRSDQWELLAWTAINRVEDQRWPSDLLEVLRQENQWQGFSENSPVLQDILSVAQEVLTVWREGGARPVAPDFVFIAQNGAVTEARTEYLDSPACRYIRR